MDNTFRETWLVIDFPFNSIIFHAHSLATHGAMYVLTDWLIDSRIAQLKKERLVTISNVTTAMLGCRMQHVIGLCSRERKRGGVRGRGKESQSLLLLVELLLYKICAKDCIVIRSCGASNTSFIAWRLSISGCWTTSMDQFTRVRHRLLVTSHLQEISQILKTYQFIFLEHELTV